MLRIYHNILVLPALLLATGLLSTLTLICVPLTVLGALDFSLVVLLLILLVLILVLTLFLVVLVLLALALRLIFGRLLFLTTADQS